MNAVYLFIKAIVLLSSFYICSSSVSAQYVFNAYTRDDGLISNEVTCTYRDSRGFLWIGSKEGLQVYNGKYFRNIRHHLLDSTSLSSDWVMSIAEDSRGFIWVGTDKGISKIHPGHLRCTRYAPGKKMSSLVNSFYSKVTADHHGTIWALTSNYLLCLKKDSFVIIDQVDRPGHLSIGNNNQLLIAIRGSLFVKKNEAGLLEEYRKEDKDKFVYTTLYQDVKGNYWIGTWAGGLLMYNSNWTNAQQFKWDQDPSNPSATNIVLSISGNKNEVYVGTSNGLYMYKIDGAIDLANPTVRLQYKPEERYGLSSSWINHIAIDQKENIWVANTGGLNASMSLNREYNEMASGTGLTTDLLWTNDGLISSSWYGKGVYFFDRKMNLVKTIPYFPESKKELNNSQISGLDLDDQGNLWVATFNGLVEYDLNRQRTLAYYTKENNGFATNRLNDVWVNKSEQEVWTANYDAGITRYDLLTGKATHVNKENSSFIVHDLIWSFYDDQAGALWILTNAGVIRYNYFTKEWRYWTEVASDTIPVKMGRANVILKDSRGIVWLGTENGLFIYLNQQWFFKGIENGLPERSVNGIVEDKKGNIWMGFPHSIAGFNSGTLSTSILSTNNGVVLPTIDLISINPWSDQLYMIGNHSIYTINKEYILASHTESPSIYLEEFLINGKSYYSMNDSFGIEKKNFRYNENNVEIGFITPNLGETGKLMYSYRIGNGGTWSASNENNRIILPQLSPGSYQIEIRATKDGLHWSKEPLRISFVIRSPFWATWWFRLLLLLVILTGMVLLVRFVSTRNLKLKILQLEKDQAIEKERSRLAGDMHDDLGSGLTKISILSEVVKKKIHNDEKVETYLENISDSSRELVQNLNNIIWSLNPGNDQLQALLAYIREYAAQFTESCQVMFETEIQPIYIDKEVAEQVRRNIFLVTKEALNNAVKHGKAERIILRIELIDPSKLRITIIDNGKGMDVKGQFGGNGLKNMEKRMKEIGGSFSLESQPGKGTSVFLEYNI